MPLPATPPDWMPLMLEATRAGLSTEFYEFGREENRRADRYLHWDDFRQRASKSGPLTIEQRWAAIRMGRTVQAQPIPLTDPSGNSFTFFLTQRAFELLHEIDLHCGGGIGVAQEGVIQADTRDNYYVTSILLHLWVAYDHPFVDGNGRTARALFYWSMLRHGFWLAEFFSISHEILKAPKQYYRAFLHTETDGNDLNYFILHQLGIIRASIDALKAHIARKQSEIEGMRKHLGPDADFNHRQLAILKHALKFPFSNYTVAGHQESHGVSYQTANNDLAQLHQRGLFNRKRISKAFVFSPVPNLAEKLGIAPNP